MKKRNNGTYRLCDIGSSHLFGDSGYRELLEARLRSERGRTKKIEVQAKFVHKNNAKEGFEVKRGIRVN